MPTVAVVTYRRPEALARMLAALPAATAGRCDRVVVVDNDPGGSAAPVVSRAEPLLHPLTVCYLAEPQPGISAARNAALAAVPVDDTVVFLDDDEVPPPGWLPRLIAAQQRFGADVVVGPVLPIADPAVPAWVRRRGLLARSRWRSGTALRWCATNNTLVTGRARALAGGGFDDSYGRTGGEDTHYFLRVTREGGRVRWADDAAVVEHVGVDRTTLSALVRRAAREGSTRARVERDLLGGARLLPTRAVKAGLLLVAGAVTALPAGLRGDRAGVAAGAVRAAKGVGMLAGLVGRPPLGYGAGR